VLEAGADCLTSGNHIWAHKDHAGLLERERRLLRPANYPDPCPGQGATVVVSAEGVRVAVLNLIGRLFLAPVDDPFQIADQLLTALRGKYDLAVVDFHAEATSEKQALAAHLDGRVAALWGTHTHVQTADARVLPKGTGYITDLGMSGPYDSIIGMERQPALDRFLTGRGTRNAPATQQLGLRGALFDLDESSGTCRGVTRIAIGGGGT
jgi:metallophosphoesterase (TIGR00282 family)